MNIITSWRNISYVENKWTCAAVTLERSHKVFTSRDNDEKSLFLIIRLKRRILTSAIHYSLWLALEQRKNEQRQIRLPLQHGMKQQVPHCKQSGSVHDWWDFHFESDSPRIVEMNIQLSKWETFFVLNRLCSIHSFQIMRLSDIHEIIHIFN